jgi:DNA-binding CsgD family transcriptional regulator
VQIEGVTLLEREHELEALRTALAETQAERGQLFLIEGPAGLGKTSLLRATLDAAAGLGFTCLRARASELERDFPYGCVRQLLEPVVSRAAPDERERLFEGVAALALPLFTHAGPTDPEASSADSAFSVLHGLYWVLNNLTRDGAVALCVDDLHWCDVESLRLLSYLAPRLDGLALAVFASARPHENVTDDLARLCACPDAKSLRLQPLTLEASATLCALRLGTRVVDEFAAACHAATGGNPFYLDVLLREAKELKLPTDGREAAQVRRFGPAAVARAVLLRLSAAPPAAARLVRAIAVLGDGPTLNEAARVAELSEEEVARIADVLVKLSILKQGTGLEFAHPIVRQAVYEDMGAHARARAHAWAARILAETGAADERIASQLAQAEPTGDAARVELLRRAAADALVQGAPAAAVAWLTRALVEPPTLASQPEVLLELGSAELRLARPEAMDHLAAAMQDLRKPRLLAHAARQLANALTTGGEADRAIAVLDSAITSVEAADPELALILEAEFAAKALQASREARARAAMRLERRHQLAGNSTGERLVLASLAFERARASESASEAVRWIEPALAARGWTGTHQPDVVGPFYALVIGLLPTDALDLGARYLEEALEDARARASIPAVAFLTVHRGWFFLRSGSVAEAEADARAALDLMSAHDIELGRRFAMALLIEALIESGQPEAAEETLRHSGGDAEIPSGLAHNALLEARGALRVARGDVRAGLDDFLEFGRRDELWGAAHPLASRWRSRACLALAAAGNGAEARQMAAEELERAQRWGAASGMGVALRAAALVDGASAIDRLREAADTLRRSPARLEHARALTDLGAALRRANRRAEARVALLDGLARARSCGADALVERASVELRAAGGRSIDETHAGHVHLTVSERRVAELAAQGHSNPRIAQTLFVTRKTVETHLGHIYAKLGISGRTELTRALAAQSPKARR